MKLGNHRGFAFVEYVTQQEAQNAITALSSTHLYGRHLVSETKLFWEFPTLSLFPIVLGGVDKKRWSLFSGDRESERR
jgi:hypothetical protein